MRRKFQLIKPTQFQQKVWIDIADFLGNCGETMNYFINKNLCFGSKEEKIYYIFWMSFHQVWVVMVSGLQKSMQRRVELG